MRLLAAMLAAEHIPSVEKQVVRTRRDAADSSLLIGRRSCCHVAHRHCSPRAAERQRLARVRSALPRPPHHSALRCSVARCGGAAVRTVGCGGWGGGCGWGGGGGWAAGVSFQCRARRGRSALAVVERRERGGRGAGRRVGQWVHAARLTVALSPTSVLPSLRPSIRPSVRPSIRPSIRPSNRPSIHPSNRVSVRLSLPPSFRLLP